MSSFIHWCMLGACRAGWTATGRTTRACTRRPPPTASRPPSSSGCAGLAAGAFPSPGATGLRRRRPAPRALPCRGSSSWTGGCCLAAVTGHSECGCEDKADQPCVGPAIPHPVRLADVELSAYWSASFVTSSPCVKISTGVAVQLGTFASLRQRPGGGRGALQRLLQVLTSPKG